MRSLTKVTSIDQITSGKTSTVKLDVGRRYHNIKITGCNLGAGAVAADTVIDKIRLVVGSRTIREISATHLLAWATLMGITVATGDLPIFFSDPSRATVRGEEATVWDMIAQGVFTLQIDVLAVAPLVPGFTIEASWDKLPSNRDQNGNPFLEIVTHRSLTKIVPIGQSVITEIPFDHFIQKILIDGTAAINWVRVERDGETVFELTVDQLLSFYNDYNIDPTAFKFPIVFDHDRQVTDALTVAQNLTLTIDSAAAQTLDILVERRVQSY